MTTKKIGAVIAAVGIAIGAYWYASPYLAMKSMQAAAEAKDADAFNDYVDYPRLRESIKGQLAAMVTEKLGASDNGAQSFGAALGMAMLGPMVDAFVRPEVVMKAMQEGKMQPKAGAGGDGSSQANLEPVKWDIQRKGVNKVIAYGGSEAVASKKPGFVFERVGFASWRLTEVRLPQAN